MDTTIYQTEIDTPVGSLFACASDRALHILQFTDDLDLEETIARLQQHLHAALGSGTNAILANVQTQLDSYFQKSLQTFTIPLKPLGTEFQQQVWNFLRTIPYGKTCSYAEEAQAIERPSATRAVANANRCNPIAIIIPCHRVIGSDGSLTGYAGGLHRKEFLLHLESASSH
jgi:AraC family transcriptional regulator of adaptative response/methylated-DNA-[protein]-cysteine methyltransferase